MQTRSRLDLTKVTLEDLCRQYDKIDGIDKHNPQKKESTCKYVWNNVFLVDYIVPLGFICYFLSML